MQTQKPDSNEGAGKDHDSSQNRVLEDSDRVDWVAPNTLVYAAGAHVATLVEWSSLYYLEDGHGFASQVWRFSELRWTHRGTMRQLQGESASDTLGPVVCLLDAKHCPPWHPIPGAEDVQVVLIQSNPRNLSKLEIFQLAKQHGF